MGRLVRQYIRISKLTGGTWGSPITKYAAEIAAEMARIVTAVGTAEGAKFGLKGSITTGNLNLIGLHGVVETLTAKNMGTGYMYGAYLEVSHVGTATMAGLFEGMMIEQYVESTTTFGSATVYGIHIANSISKQPSSYAFCRFSEDGVSYVDDVFLITKGASCTNIKYLFDFVYGAAIDMVATVGAASGAAGYLKIKCNAADRYIQLYSTPP